MPVLTNAKYERFAQGLASGKSADEAYEAAGYSAHRGNASRLSANESVLRRVAELQQRAADRVEVTVASLIAEAEEVRVLAVAAGQFAPAISAIKEKGILSGNRVEKRENTNRTLSDLSDDELSRIAVGGSDRAPASTGGSALTH